MKRSWTLTAGSKLGIFGILFISALITFGFNLIFAQITKAIVGYTFAGELSFRALLPSIVQSALLLPFTSCIAILVYFNLRIEKEGFAIEHLAQNFSIEINSENEADETDLS